MVMIARVRVGMGVLYYVGMAWGRVPALVGVSAGVGLVVLQVLCGVPVVALKLLP